VSKGGRNRQKAREKIAQMRAKEARRRRRRNWVIGAGAAVVVVIAAVGIALAVTRSGGGGSAEAGGTSPIAGVQSFTGLARTHVQGKVRYPQTPPVGGKHNPVPLNCGIYPSPVPNENGVHSLEHGAVWITYRPGLPAAGVTRLQDLVRGEPQAKRAYTILSPYPGLPAPVVASAWGKQLRLKSAADARLQRFITTYAQGPQTPEPGAACSGGVGTPAG